MSQCFFNHESRVNTLFPDRHHVVFLALKETAQSPEIQKVRYRVTTNDSIDHNCQRCEVISIDSQIKKNFDLDFDCILYTAARLCHIGFQLVMHLDNPNWITI